MAETRENHRIVTLQRARRGADLWAAVEAAQYGHILHGADGDSPADTAPESAFADGFREIVEAWEGASPEGQAMLIGRLDACVDRLHASGRYVHWGLVQQTVVASGTTTEIPVAIVGIGADADATLTLALPTAPVAAQEEPGRD